MTCSSVHTSTLLRRAFSSSGRTEKMPLAVSLMNRGGFTPAEVKIKKGCFIEQVCRIPAFAGMTDTGLFREEGAGNGKQSLGVKRLGDKGICPQFHGIRSQCRIRAQSDDREAALRPQRLE